MNHSTKVKYLVYLVILDVKMYMSMNKVMVMGRLYLLILCLFYLYNLNFFLLFFFEILSLSVGILPILSTKNTQ